MNNRFFALMIIVTINFLWTINTLAAPKKFTGTDYSGVYSCKGSNVKIGNYELIANFVINKPNSRGNIGSYDLIIETENSTTYSGQAIANGNNMAITIEIIDGSNQAYSTGVANLKKFKPKRFSYIHHYYESNQAINRSEINDTGNYGSENCVMKKSKVTR